MKISIPVPESIGASLLLVSVLGFCVKPVTPMQIILAAFLTIAGVALMIVYPRELIDTLHESLKIEEQTARNFADKYYAAVSSNRSLEAELKKLQAFKQSIVNLIEGKPDERKQQAD